MMKPSESLISIDDLLETDPCIIIPKLLDSIPQESCLGTPNQGSPTENDANYQGNDDFDPFEDLEDIIFGDVSPTKLFIPSPQEYGIIKQRDSSSSAWFSPISSDTGYEADDDYDPCDDLEDEIFGDLSPSRYFHPSPSRFQGMKDNYIPELSVPKDTHTYSSSSLDSSSDSEDEMETEVCPSADQVSSRSSSSDNESDGHILEDRDFNDSLRETALALRNVLIDLEVIETYDRLGGDEFGDVLVEVRPKSLPDGPTLVAYRDAYGQITVPLEMGCNQHAAAILKKKVSRQDTDSVKPQQISSLSGWQMNDNLNMFVSSSEFENDSEFESCDEEELMNLAKESDSRAHKRCHDELNSNDDDNDPMTTPPNSHHIKIQRLD